MKKKGFIVERLLYDFCIILGEEKEQETRDFSIVYFLSFVSSLPITKILNI